MVGLEKNLWIIANWKSNKDISEALEWIDQVGPSLEKKDNIKIVVCPEFNVLNEVKKAISVGNYPLILGAQDLSPFPAGAYTGEESAKSLAYLINLVILGHSERRQNFGEDDQLVAKKVTQALSNNIIPLVCVQSDQTPVPEGCRLVAYEPIFAIGTGNPDTPENAEVVAKSLKQKYGQDLEVLYGGSVDSQNIELFLGQGDISGVLIGKASLDTVEFIKIVKASI